MASALSAGACLASRTTLFPSAPEILAAFGSRLSHYGIQVRSFLRGAPHVPAAGETALARTETILGPIWVWLAFGETPAAATLIGGGIILAAVVFMAPAGAGPPMIRAAK
jgi:drug/metabolite transporter (DMT)-like permease